MNRGATHAVITAALAAMSDAALGDLLAGGRPLGAGIGGTSALVSVAGHAVFVKKVPLTVLERRPGNVMSTANLFDLPLYCQYRIGSPGFGVWREVAAHLMVTERTAIASISVTLGWPLRPISTCPPWNGRF